MNRFLQVWEDWQQKTPGCRASRVIWLRLTAVLVFCWVPIHGAVNQFSLTGSRSHFGKLVCANPEEPEYKVALVQAYGATAGELSLAGHVKNKEAENFFQRLCWRAGKNSLPKFPLPNVIGRRSSMSCYCGDTITKTSRSWTTPLPITPGLSSWIRITPMRTSSLGDACARLGRWDEAQAEIGRAAELDPGNQWYMFHASVLQLRAGDLAGYRRVCREMLKRFGDTRKPEVAERTAKTCLLAPDAVADLAPVLTLADRAVRGTEKSSNYRYFVLVKGLAEYPRRQERGGGELGGAVAARCRRPGH